MQGSITLENIQEELEAVRKALKEAQSNHMFVAVHDQGTADEVRRLARGLWISDEDLDIYVQPHLLQPGEAVVGRVPPLAIPVIPDLLDFTERESPLPLRTSHLPLSP